MSFPFRRILGPRFRDHWLPVSGRNAKFEWPEDPDYLRCSRRFQSDAAPLL